MKLHEFSFLGIVLAVETGSFTNDLNHGCQTYGITLASCDISQCFFPFMELEWVWLTWAASLTLLILNQF